MKFNIKATSLFEKKLKKIAKKHKTISKDLFPIIEQLSYNPTIGINLGRVC